MKTLGFIVILCSGILVLLLLLVPVGVSTQIDVYPEQHLTALGKLRVADITVSNHGWFTQTVRLPELTACVGDQEIPLDSWPVSDDSIARGEGQLSSIRVAPGQTGTAYVLASDNSFYENMLIYRRYAYFSCLEPGTPLQ